jgi:Uma2 family endonuclease
MMGRPQLAPKQMTIEEFLAFTDTRPQEEHWELIEGVPVLGPSPTDYHQLVVTHIVTFLMRAKVEKECIMASDDRHLNQSSRVNEEPAGARRHGERALANRHAGVG